MILSDVVELIFNKYNKISYREIVELIDIDERKLFSNISKEEQEYFSMKIDGNISDLKKHFGQYTVKGIESDVITFVNSYDEPTIKLSAVKIYL